jgi:hypothetical protein
MLTQITTVNAGEHGVKQQLEKRRSFVNRCRALSCLFPPLIGFALTASHEVMADPVEVINPSFELPALSEGGFTSGVVDGWETTPPTGVFYPQTFQFTLPLPDGNQVGYANFDTGQLAQTLSATLQSNTTYTLTVYVGKRLDCCYPNPYSVELYAGSALLGSENSQDPAPGDFAVSTITFTSSDSDPLEGSPLRIVLKSVGTGQVGFDNVSLDATAF